MVVPPHALKSDYVIVGSLASAGFIEVLKGDQGYRLITFHVSTSLVFVVQDFSYLPTHTWWRFTHLLIQLNLFSPSAIFAPNKLFTRISD